MQEMPPSRGAEGQLLDGRVDQLFEQDFEALIAELHITLMEGEAARRIEPLLGHMAA